MSDSEDTATSDFDSQLRGLFLEAEREIEKRSAPANHAPANRDPDVDDSKAAVPAAEDAPARAGSKSAGPMSLPQLLRPIVQGLESLSRGAGANAALLQKIDSRLGSDGPAPDRLTGIAGELRAMLEMKQGVNQNMFAALHEELKGYKDGFLLEAVQRPIIRDLITIYDELSELRRQVGQSVSEPMPEDEKSTFTTRLYERLRSLHTRLDHQIEFVLEVLARLEVSQIDPHLGKLNKQSQRAVAVEMAEDPEEDCLVVKVLRRGFQWRDRILRAEEVVIKKWKEGYLVALQPENEEPA